MSTLDEIELAIAALTPAELVSLYTWLEQNYPHPIEAQLQADLDAGWFDSRINRAVSDHKAGRTRPTYPRAQ